ncbi:hypothetical protein LCGC14_0682370 [marine sediment metagenome]|uniref:Calcineurin-like phosphoesterase domain-containing protein n=1 Tax=marine sediment metagenome TaxID=412755 RepID=A0A0F9TVV1_9ZZZZ
MYFFTADQHYGHGRIIEHCDRPYKNENEMDEDMIAKHNEVVGKDDTVINAGDFCWFKQYAARNSNDNAYSYISRLNGRQIFLRGDHDKWMSARASHFHDIWSNMMDKKNDEFLVVCHYAMHTWARSHYNSWHLYAHSHKDLNLPGKRHCISVDNTNFFPLSFDQVKEIMARKDDNPNFIKPEDRYRR